MAFSCQIRSWKTCFSQGYLGNRHVHGSSIVRRQSLRLTRFDSAVYWSWKEKKDLLPRQFSKRKKEMHVHIRFAPSTFSESVELWCACPIVRREKLADRTQTVNPFTAVDWSPATMAQISHFQVMLRLKLSAKKNTHFKSTVILVIERRIALISLIFFETKKEMDVHSLFVRTFNNFRVR